MSSNDQYNEEAINRLPESVKLGWGIMKKQRRGPKGELSIPQIVQAAIAIADAEGLAAVSMARVAQSLGFTTMSLYRYVSSKNDLLLLMQDAVCDIPIPEEREGDSWREQMKEYVRVCVGVFRDHPWYADIPIQGLPLMPNNLRVIDWMLRIMRDFPVNDFEKMSFLLLVSSYSRACGLIERDQALVLQAGGTMDAFNGLDYTTALQELVKPGQFPFLSPLIMSGAYTGETGNPIEDDLAFGLERILDGIEQYVETRRCMGAK
ncbi:TetR/AcrR family transcriptional regulator [Paenibacillus sp. LHD-117]|uniref:TetR/AcrR family transcriptional regulator n=1 Tax=Paenibacillus sp. LHD-117 TaxID=3071412 RepID=UPI0027DF89C3|nr:TetR/AcrR family transcriptional regulator [Paenibacillus sp. LHD-117]MDQ6423229.1 TetR/AcrR family transcriptional regulator [Paenibacillus sp. LHD-117]